MTTFPEPPKRRWLLTCDGTSWYVRRLNQTTLEPEKVMHTGKPLGISFDTLEAAVLFMRGLTDEEFNAP